MWHILFSYHGTSTLGLGTWDLDFDISLIYDKNNSAVNSFGFYIIVVVDISHPQKSLRSPKFKTIEVSRAGSGYRFFMVF
jgi:hypothetical protein